MTRDLEKTAPKRLLLAVDGSPAAAHAVRLVASYRGEPSHLATSILNVQPQPVSLWLHPSIDAEALEPALRERGEREVEAARSTLASAGIAAATRVGIGIPAYSILEAAQDKAAGQLTDLIVMGTRGLGGFAALVGAVAMRVAHGSKTPTLLVKQDARLPAALGERLRVLVPVDGSRQALNAAARLASWSDWLGTIAVDLVSVREPLGVLSAILPPHDDVVSHWGGKALDEATRGARAVFAASNIRHDLHGVTGDAADTIARLAEEFRSDLIVMGTRGLGAAHHVLIGSVALKVVHQATVPVLLVP